MSNSLEVIKNRIQKNYKKLHPWSQRHNIDAYRLYDRDIPEFPFIVDKYQDYYVIYDKSDILKDKDKNHLPLLTDALLQLFKTSQDQLIIKKRERQSGLQQYEKLSDKRDSIVVKETQAQVLVNLWDYLDTGLFLDHRPLRQIVYNEARDKKVLNLFCYTGAISVFAALGGALEVVSVDLSQTYLNWARSNFMLNNIELDKHRFINENALEFLKNADFLNYFDLIILDPPTFSNSKKMDSDFDVERDQDELIINTMKKLQPEGTLYFSNNKRKFKISDEILEKYLVQNITVDTIPIDFHDQKIHQCFRIKKK